VPAGFARPLTAETAIEIAAHHGIGALARRQLCRGTAPYTVLNLARGWNSASGRPVLSDDIVIAIVDGACARELARESRDDAA
jgi:hypothetical protein